MTQGSTHNNKFRITNTNTLNNKNFEYGKDLNNSFQFGGMISPSNNNLVSLQLKE